ncbi:MAG TPA: hydrogenase maturation nickel metallochaperone HypA [Kofleriaceae bacterium]|jgi:hydrogenase nickel incorporation protein HypA/HybF|nr:hydrogenase maturation nickel metallochaperone HypA [Kofleriaceae bacterium]
MHEYSIVSALVDRVQREADAHRGAIVRKLHLRIGELAGVEIELLRTAFLTFRERGVCAAAEIDIEPVPAAWRCKRCELPIAAGAVLRCPRCGRPAELAAGDDIILERIEMEVPDV